MTTYYHVTAETYSRGEDLLSFNEYVQANGENPPYKWADDVEIEFYGESKDAQVVCVFESLTDAQDFAAEYGGIVTRIDIPQWAIDERLVRKTRVGEGYTAFWDRIPGEFVTVQS